MKTIFQWVAVNRQPMQQKRTKVTKSLVPLLESIVLLLGVFSASAQVSRSLGTLQPGQTCIITFDVVINTNFPLNTFSVTNQGSVTGTGFSPILTDDPTVGGASDATVTLLPADFDFGDAPAPHATLLADNGARHIIPFTGATLFLGAAPPDAEINGQPHAGALGDDLAGVDDEEGVIIPPFFTRSTGSNITITASASGILNAWIDWNADGDWSDPGEQIIVNQNVAAGVNVFSIVAPTNTVTGSSAARFRLSSLPGLLPTGQASDGEVEDYMASFVVTAASTNAEQRVILDLKPVTNGVLVTFAGIAGQTGFVQAAATVLDPWTNISPPMLIGGSAVTSFIEITNSAPATRAYRAYFSY
jgi:hypothetical protein